ncbi:MAG: hypothetical protein GX458_01855 [Phyllobacteriaceae bacterium]|nr:hypothetical protein [Phyllobacteriaceae bacterium]
MVTARASARNAASRRRSSAVGLGRGWDDPGDGVVATLDDDRFADLDPDEQFGEAGLGFADLDGDDHGASDLPTVLEVCVRLAGPSKNLVSSWFDHHR